MNMLYNLYFWVYHWPPLLLLFVAVMISCAWAMFTEHAAVRKRKAVITCNAILLAIFILLILYSTIFDRDGSEEVILHLIPFHTFRDGNWQPELYRSTLMNVVLFYPFGLILSCMITKKSWRTAILVLCVAALFSCCIECYQYIARIGEGDIDDVIFNTVGAILGYDVAMLGHPLLQLISSACKKLSSKIKSE